ncbi:MAG: hypothetical protein QOG97_86 [Acidimicrobiaceae bacterium]|nr:hypothetical protein [Acidimicrobiaceae bacterium]
MAPRRYPLPPRRMAAPASRCTPPPASSTRLHLAPRSTWFDDPVAAMASRVAAAPAGWFRRPEALGWLRRLQATLVMSLAASKPELHSEVDATVVAQARTGDVGAFGHIVDHYDRRLRALAYGLLGERDLMDDVLQEVYVKAFRALPPSRATPRSAPGSSVSPTTPVSTSCAAIRRWSVSSPMDPADTTRPPRLPAPKTSPSAPTTWPRRSPH